MQAAIAASRAPQLVVCSQCWGLACEVGRSSPLPTAVSFWCYSHRRVLEGPATRQIRAARHARAAQLAGGGKVAANDGGTLPATEGLGRPAGPLLGRQGGGGRRRAIVGVPTEAGVEEDGRRDEEEEGARDRCPASEEP